VQEVRIGGATVGVPDAGADAALAAARAAVEEAGYDVGDGARPRARRSRPLGRAPAAADAEERPHGCASTGLVVGAGLGAIVWVYWYFFGAERATAAATTSAAPDGDRRRHRRRRSRVAGATSRRWCACVRARPCGSRSTGARRRGAPRRWSSPAFGVRRFLPPHQRTVVEVTPPAPGTYEFTCGMGMLRGRLVAE
jgi:8-oxo-dGTP pyrophosphatase MutT (NUDIX family)